MRKRQKSETIPWVPNHHIADDGEIGADSLAVAIRYYEDNGDVKSSTLHQMTLSSSLIANAVIRMMTNTNKDK